MSESETNPPTSSTNSLSADHPNSYDVIIAGGGISGLLVAHKYCSTHPDARVLVLEKNGELGGRLGTISGDSRGVGFNSITPRLYQFWNQAIKQDPEADDLPSLVSKKQSQSAILMGNKLSEVGTRDLFTEKGARALGGLAAQRQWQDVKSLLDAEEGHDKTFGDLWKSPRKSPAIMVLETYSQAFGITNIWDSSPKSIAERGAFYTSEPYTGNWSAALAALTKNFETSGQLLVKRNARIIEADHDGDEWHIQTAQGHFLSDRLVIAQPPWIASQWLPKKLWPTQLLTVINKTKPVSLVILNAPIQSGFNDQIPQLVMIPSESVQASISTNEIVFQATIDYELSLQAPDVVKAVKRLKRACKKLLAAVPDLKIGVERVALVPVAWAQTPNLMERKHIDRLHMHDIQDRHLAFCGDAYGQSLNGDDNLIESVLSASEALNL